MVRVSAWDSVNEKPSGRSAPVARLAVRASDAPSAGTLSCWRKFSRFPIASMYLRLGSKAVRSKVDVRVRRVLRSTGRIRPSSRPREPLSPDAARNAWPRSTATPISLARELLVVLGRMNAPLSPSTRTGSRLLSVRERMKLLLVRNRGRSQDASAGVSASGGRRGSGRAPRPTGMPRKKRRLVVGQPADRRRVGIDPQVAGAGEVAAQVQHADRLPGESGRVAPQVGERQRRPEQPVVAARHREAERGRVGLVPVEAAGEAGRARAPG